MLGAVAVWKVPELRDHSAVLLLLIHILGMLEKISRGKEGHGGLN
jgi:hypothetical protein